MLNISVSSIKRLISLNSKVNVTLNCRWAREIKMVDNTICFESVTRVVSYHTRSIPACRGGVFTWWNKGPPKVLVTAEVEPQSWIHCSFHWRAWRRPIDKVQGPVKSLEAVSEKQKSRSTLTSRIRAVNGPFPGSAVTEVLQLIKTRQKDPNKPWTDKGFFFPFAWHWHSHWNSFRFKGDNANLLTAIMMFQYPMSSFIDCSLTCCQLCLWNLTFVSFVVQKQFSEPAGGCCWAVSDLIGF